MKKNLKITPEGTKDFLFAECSAMDDVCGKIEQVFVGRGFKKVITPGIEFYDVFSVECSGIDQQEVTIYSVTGVTLGSHVQNGFIQLPSAAYIVKVNNETTSINE